MGTAKKTTTIGMNTVLSGLISKAVSATNRADGAKGKAIEAFVKAGWTGCHFYAPGEKSLATEESWVFLNQSIIDGFPAETRDLVMMSKEDAKGLTRAKKDKRRDGMQRIGARRADLRKGVEAALKAKGSGRAPGRKRLPDQRVMEELAELIKFLKTLDPTDRVASNGLNVEGVKKLLEDAFKLAKG